MATAIVGVGNIGGAVPRHLVRGGEQVMLATRDFLVTAAIGLLTVIIALARSVSPARTSPAWTRWRRPPTERAPRAGSNGRVLTA